MIRILLGSLSLFLSSIQCGYAGNDSDTDICHQLSCMIVVDAGSTGSRLHLYAYEKDNHANPIHINELYNKKITPGFAAVQLQTEAVYKYLDRLFDGTPVQNIPVYFYSTAGMRLLPNVQQQELYRFLKQWFWAKQQWTLQEARTISGSEEGALGWLGLNYHINTFQSSDTLPAGLIEVGGASVQLVFPIDNMTDVAREDVVRISAYGQQFLLYVHSFLGVGLTEAAKHVTTVPACFPLDYPLSNGEFAFGNAAACEQALQQTLQVDDATRSSAKAAVKNNPTYQWYTVGAASFLVQQATDYFKGTGFTPNTLLNYVDSTYCQKNWSTLQALYPNDPYLQQNCISGSLFYNLTVDSFGFASDQAIQTLADGTTADWTLGVVVHQAD